MRVERNPFIGLIKSETNDKWTWIDNNETVLENSAIWEKVKTNGKCSVLRRHSTDIWKRPCTKEHATGLCEIITD